MMTNSQPSGDVIDVLISDHRDVTALIGEIWSVKDSMIRRDLTDTAISELVRHAVAEEMYVYPVMRKYLADGERAVEAALRRLETLLADHVQDEESDQFPELRRRVPQEELTELAGKVETAKKLAPTRPHPAAPNSELFHKLVGPGVGLVDRLRDKLTGRATR
jgi:hemerythrin superfamily protein